MVDGPKRTGTTSTLPPAPSPEDATERLSLPMTPRKKAVIELLGIPLIPLTAMAAYAEKKRPGEISPYTLDVATIGMHSEPLADAVVGMADNYPVLAAALDKIAITTPFMALVAVGITIGAQIAENHGKLPDAMRGVSPGIIDRHEFASQLAGEVQARMSTNGNGSPTE